MSVCHKTACLRLVWTCLTYVSHMSHTCLTYVLHMSDLQQLAITYTACIKGQQEQHFTPASNVQTVLACSMFVAHKDT